MREATGADAVIAIGVVTGEFDAVTGIVAGETEHDGPAGDTAQATVAVPANPAAGVKLMPYVAACPGCTVVEVGPDGATVNGITGAAPVPETDTD